MPRSIDDRCSWRLYSETNKPPYSVRNGGLPPQPRRSKEPSQERRGGSDLCDACDRPTLRLFEFQNKTDFSVDLPVIVPCSRMVVGGRRGHQEPVSRLHLRLRASSIPADSGVPKRTGRRVRIRPSESWASGGYGIHKCPSRH